MRSRIAIAAGALALLACVSLPKAGPDLQASALSFAADSGVARIYVIRPEGFAGSAVPLEVIVDSTFVGKLMPGTFVMTQVAAGSHTVRCPSGESKASLSIVADPDSVYYIKLVPAWGVWIASASIEQLTTAEGQKRVRETTMVLREGTEER